MPQGPDIVCPQGDQLVPLCHSYPPHQFLGQIPCSGQVLGRVVTHMLEFETNDNVVKWNTLDFALPSRGIQTEEQFKARNERMVEMGRDPLPDSARFPEFPIYKLLTPKPLPTTI